MHEQTTIDGGAVPHPPPPLSDRGLLDRTEHRSPLDARKDLAAKLDEGARCPCCGQHAQIYRRKLNATMVRCLAALHAAGGSSGFVHGPTALREYGLTNVGGDVGKLALFGLVREDDRKREDGGRAGYWGVTPRGYEFLTGDYAAPRYALVYDGKRVAYEGGLVSVAEVAPDFNLRDLMAGI